jgi:hypothetical protein
LALDGAKGSFRVVTLPLARSRWQVTFPGFSPIVTTRKRNIPIVQLKWKPLDKLLLLWTICLIAHRRERNESIAYGAIKLDFGADIVHIFQTYCWAAMDAKLLDETTMQLTPKGLVAVEEWQRINEKLFSF